MTPKYSFPAARKIELFIAGAQKAGTTSLKNYLGEHPDVQTHVQKEFAYFYDDVEYRGGPEDAYRKYFGKETDNRKLIAKNAGLYVKEEAIRRLQLHNPECKIVLLLRNPVDRAYSAFQMEKNYGNCSGDFDDLKSVFEKEDKSDWRFEFFIRMGMYGEYVRLLRKYFPVEQTIILKYEDFAADNKSTCEMLFKKLGVSPDFTPDLSVKHNVTHISRSTNYARMMVRLLRNDNQLKRAAKKLLPFGKDYKLGEMLRNINKTQEKPGRISGNMHRFLSAFYEPHNQELQELTGIDFSSWKKAYDEN
jgi:hypothetical protein